MTKNKRFVKYDGNTIVDLKLVKSWIVSNGDVDLLIELLNDDKEYMLTEENKKLKQENKELQKYLGWQDMELQEMEDLND